MHIQLSRHPNHDHGCGNGPRVPLIALQVVSHFTRMDQEKTAEWVGRLNPQAIHTCHGNQYVYGHEVLRYLIENDPPALEPRAALQLLSNKLAPYLFPHSPAGTSLRAIARDIANRLALDAALNLNPHGQHYDISQALQLAFQPARKAGTPKAERPAKDVTNLNDNGGQHPP